MTESQKSVKPLSLPVKLAFGCFFFCFFVLGATVLSVLIELIGIAAGWWDDRHAFRILAEEFNYFPTTPQLPLMPSVEFAHGWVIAGLSFVITPPWESDLKPVVFLGADQTTNLIAVTSSIYVIATRTVFGVFASLLFVVMAYLSVHLGFTERDLRKFGGATESDHRHYFTLRRIPWWFSVAWVIYLLFPTAIHPQWIIGPATLMFSILMAVAACYWTKHT